MLDSLRHLKTVSVNLNKDMTKEAPTKKLKTTDPRMDKHASLKTTCRELERDEEQEIQSLLDERGVKETTLDKKFKNKIQELNRIHAAKIADLRSDYSIKMNDIKLKRRDIKVDITLELSELEEDLGMCDCEKCDKAFCETDLDAADTLLWDGDPRCPDCINLRDCENCDEECMLKDMRFCGDFHNTLFNPNCCRQKGCPSCIVKKESYCDYCGAEFMCEDCIEEMDTMNSMSCGKNICYNCTDHHQDDSSCDC
jgi:hypothetical protein